MPLHAAVSTGNEVIVDILLTAKADPFVLNGNGSSCVDLAHANVALKQKFRDVLKVPFRQPRGRRWQVHANNNQRSCGAQPVS